MERASALLVHDYEYPLGDLIPPLRRLGLESQRARNCAEAKSVLTSARPPVFTDTELPDGGWQETVALGRGASSRVPVIVVSRVVDISLYLDAIERGATEFIVPPFRDAEIAYVVQGVRMSVSRRAPRVRSNAKAASAPGSRYPLFRAERGAQLHGSFKPLF